MTRLLTVALLGLTALAVGAALVAQHSHPAPVPAPMPVAGEPNAQLPPEQPAEKIIARQQGGKVPVPGYPSGVSSVLSLTVHVDGAAPTGCTLVYNPSSGKWEGTGNYAQGLCNPGQTTFRASLESFYVLPQIEKVQRWRLRMWFAPSTADTCVMDTAAVMGMGGMVLVNQPSDPLHLTFQGQGNCQTCTGGESTGSIRE